jgi:putative ABC transport system permease protein
MSTINQVREVNASARESTPQSSSGRRNFLPPLKKGDFDRAGKLGSNIAIALEALWANRLRSMLTALGIFIGVAAVIAALILTQGVSANINNTIASLGTNVITVSPGTSSNRGAFTAAGSSPSLTPADATAASKIANVTAYTPVVSQSAQVIYNNQNWNTRVQGVMPSYQQIQNWTLSQGSWYSDANERDSRTVAVLGQTVVDKLFGASGDNPIGKTIRIGTDNYRVVGVLESKSSGGSQDDIIDIPFSTAMARLKNTRYVDQIVVQVNDSSNIDSVQSAVKTQIEKNQ